MKYSFTLSTLMLAMALTACSKETPSAETVKIVSEQADKSPEGDKPLQHAQFKGLANFNGKPAWDLVKDDVIGKRIKEIVPQSQFKCMDDIFNYMPDLELQSDGSVQASLNGAHVDQFMEAFISASPNGSINVVLNCDPQSIPKGKYQFFTNQEPQADPAKEVLEWIYVVGSDDDKVLRSDGEKMVEIPFGKFVQAVTPESKPVVTVATPPVSARAMPNTEARPSPKLARPVQLYVNAGATICGDMYGMNKARAIAKTGNPYAKLPESCVIMTQSAPTRILRESTQIPGVVIIDAGKTAAMVDRNDLSLR